MNLRWGGGVAADLGGDYHDAMKIRGGALLVLLLVAAPIVHVWCESSCGARVTPACHRHAATSLATAHDCDTEVLAAAVSTFVTPPPDAEAATPSSSVHLSLPPGADLRIRFSSSGPPAPSIARLSSRSESDRVTSRA